MVGRRAVAVVWIVIAIVAAGPTAMWAQPVAPAPARREVRIGIPGLSTTIDLGMTLDGAVPLVARQIFDTLVTYRDGTTDIEPALATRWTVSRDGLVWTFTLRDNVRFHDGTALTAAAVVTSFDRHLRAGTLPAATVWAALLRGAPGVVREVRAIDAQTVQFTLHQPYAPLLSVLAHPGFGIARQTTAPDGTERLVGTGPYRITESSAGRLTLDAVATHWAGPPRAERLVFLEVTTDDDAEAEFDAGALDVWLPVEPPRRAQGALSIPGPRVGYLAFQTEKEPFSRKKIRQAVAAAIDPAVLGIALDRAAVPLQSFLPPGVWGRREGWPILGGTRKAVAGLLKEGNWPQGFTPTLLASKEDGVVHMRAVAEALQIGLQGADIPVKLRLETEQVTATARASGEHDMVLAEASVLGGDPHLFLYPLSTSEGAGRGRQALNFSFYRNPRLDDVLIRASQIGFRPERQRLYQRAQVMLTEELPWIPLYAQLLWAVARPDVRGLRLHPSGFPRLSTIWLEGPAIRLDGPGIRP